MSVAVLLFLGLVLTSALAAVVTVALFVHVLRRVDVRWPARVLMAIALPWGAIEVWRRGRRALPLLWAASIAAYAGLRIIALTVELA